MNKVTLSRPAAGETVRIVMRCGHVYCLEFDLGEATVAESGKDVVLTFDDGSGMVLQNFFSAATIGDFYLTLPDGVVLSGKAVVDSLAFSPENFHPGEGHGFLNAGHDGDSSLFRGLEEDSRSAIPPETRYELSAGHDSPAPSFFPEKPHEADPFAFRTAFEKTPGSLQSFAESPKSAEDGASPSLSLFFPHDGRNAPHLDDVLDSSMPLPRDVASDDLESLLPPSAGLSRFSAPGARQEDGGGEAPADASAAQASLTAVFPASPGDESQDQHLLAHLFLLSL